MEISGIPASVGIENLEEAVVNICNEANVKVHGKSVTKFDLEAVHRIGKKNGTIARFVNRKFAYEALHCGKNLKGKDIFKANQGIYINPSLCWEFKFIGYVIRKLKGTGLVEQYRIRNGVYSIKVGNDFKEISHKSDFDKYGLDISMYTD